MNLLPASRKARITTGLSAVLALLGFAFLSTYLVVQSSTFKGYLSKNLTELLGEHVDIGQEIRINKIFPRLSVVLPNVKIRPTSLGNNVERVRVDSLTASISPDVLFSGGEKGSVNIHVNEVTLLSATTSPTSSMIAMVKPRPAAPAAQTNQLDSDSSHPPSPTLENRSTEASIAHTLKAFLQSSSSLQASLTTDRLVYIIRDVETGNQRYDITQLSLRSEDQAIQLAALVDVTEQPQRSVTASFRAIESADDNTGNTLHGELSLEMTSMATDSSGLQHTQLAGETHAFDTPVEINGNRIALTSIEYHAPSSWIRGTFDVDMNTAQTHIQADLEIRKLQLSLARKHKDNSATNASASTATTSRLFPYTPFSFRIPQHLVAQINVHMGAIRLDSTPIINGSLMLSVADGEAQLTTQDLTLLGGPSEISATFTNPEYGLANVLMKLEADDMQLNRIRAPESGEPILSKGKADLIMALRGSGPSPGHIAASSNGYVLAAVDSAEINQKYSTAIDRGVVSWGLERIYVLTSQSEPEQALSRLSDPLSIQCASFKLYLNDGRAEVSNGAIIEFPQNTLYSSGFINLRDENLGFAFRARNKSLFDWSAISIARFAEFSGSLTDPSVTLNKNELAKQGILSTSSIMWGPLPSLVYTLAESGVKNARSKQCHKSIE